MSEADPAIEPTPGDDPDPDGLVLVGGAPDPDVTVAGRGTTPDEGNTTTTATATTTAEEAAEAKPETVVVVAAAKEEVVTDGVAAAAVSAGVVGYEGEPSLKREREVGDRDGEHNNAASSSFEGGGAKHAKLEVESELNQDMDEADGDLIPAAKEGTSFFSDADVLSGRGGGTNVHPGNRNFRDLINLHRRSYLKARKNDKPAISRAIVRSIRDTTGRFLRKDDKTGLWFEIGDDAAREKTSQALRQRAPEMRKLLFDTEREEARSAAEDHLRHQRMMMGMPPDAPPGMPGAANGGMQMPPMAFTNPAFFQAMAANGGKPPGASPNGQQQDPYQVFQAAMMNTNMNRYAPAPGAPP